MSLEQLPREGEGFKDMLEGLKQSISVENTLSNEANESYQQALQQLENILERSEDEALRTIYDGLKSLEIDGNADKKVELQMLLEDIVEKNTKQKENPEQAGNIDKKFDTHAYKINQEIKEEASLNRLEIADQEEQKYREFLETIKKLPPFFRAILLPPFEFLARKSEML